MALILLVDDEESIIDFISYNLELHGYRVEVARTGAQAVDKALALKPGLVILDVMLPDFDGFEVLKRLRRAGSLPVLMLSALDTVVDKVVGLELGADDYLSKPFSVKELLARVKALLRRTSPAVESAVLESGGLVVDCGRYECTVDGAEVVLTNKEFELLEFLLINEGLALSRAAIIQAVWGLDTPSGERTVDSHIKTLRRKLHDAGFIDRIETLRGVGYRFAAEKRHRSPGKT
ncbi:MAG: response regulator transcription factor [Candidatus Geothermincolia bacterium]